MEIQLKELIEQIKKDGVDAAEVKAAAIISAANAEAEKIIAEAKLEAEKKMTAAKNENERMVKASEDAIRQAGRNVLISFRESVTKEADAIVRNAVKEAYSPANLSGLVLKVVEAWTKNNDAEDISVLLNSSDLKEMEEAVTSSLKEKMLGGITLKASNNFDGGFRIAVNNGQAYYDYSEEAVVDMLSAYLSPRVTAILKEADGK